MDTIAATLFEAGRFLCLFSAGLAAASAAGFFLRGSFAIRAFWRPPMPERPGRARLEAAFAAFVFGLISAAIVWLAFPPELQSRYDPAFSAAAAALASAAVLYAFLRRIRPDALPRRSAMRLGRTGLWIAWGTSATAAFFLLALPAANAYGSQVLAPPIARPLAIAWALLPAAGAALGFFSFASLAWADPLTDFARAWRIAGLGGAATLAFALALGQGYLAQSAYPKPVFSTEGPGGRRLEIVAHGFAEPRLTGLVGTRRDVLWRPVFAIHETHSSDPWRITWFENGRGVQVERGTFAARLVQPAEFERR